MSRWMSEKLLKEVQRTAKTHCANYQSGDRCPLSRSGMCHYFEELQPEEQVHRCTWMESAVLGNEPQVEAEYQERIGRYLNADSTPSTQMIGTCQRCRKDYVKRSRNEKFCADCKQSARKEANRLRQRKRREQIARK